MRRLSVFLGASLIAVSGVDAQALYVGVRAGQGWSEQAWRVRPQPVCFDFGCDVVVGDFSGRTERHRYGVSSGITVTRELASWVALEGELLYVEKGMRDALGFAQMRMTYVEAPVLLRVAVPITSFGLNIFFHGGPAPARETSCVARGFDGVKNLTSVPCEFFRDSKTDFGWAAGGGFLVRLPTYQVTFSWRRTQGNRDLNGDDPSFERFNDARAFLVGFSARVK